VKRSQWRDLQTALDRVYDAAGYGDYIYDGVPHPPLRDEDVPWAMQFVPGSDRAAPEPAADS
jgi:hypothetical protein